MVFASRFLRSFAVLGVGCVVVACADEGAGGSPFTGAIDDVLGADGAVVGVNPFDGGGFGSPFDASAPMLDAGFPQTNVDASTGPVNAADGSVQLPTDDAGSVGEDASTPTASGTCCADGDCLCHGPQPTELTSATGPYDVSSFTIPGAGCVHYPTDAEPPFAAVTVSDGFLGSGGCGFSQTGDWGPLYASWGIVAMIIDTTGADQPPTRGEKLGNGVEAFKSANEDPSSPLYGKLSGRYGTSGFSMGGGGTSYASRDDSTLRSSVAIMPYGTVRSGIEVPTLVICGNTDGTAPCSGHGTPLYNGIADSVPKMRVTVSSGHRGQPSAGNGASGEYGLAFQKVFLEGDERWRPLLVAADSNETNIR